MKSMIDVPNQKPVRYRDPELAKVDDWSFYFEDEP